jgi:hypothetical protein
MLNAAGADCDRIIFCMQNSFLHSHFLLSAGLEEDRGVSIPRLFGLDTTTICMVVVNAGEKRRGFETHEPLRVKLHLKFQGKPEAYVCGIHSKP